MYVGDAVDYDSGIFDVTFNVGDSSATVSININDDNIDEGSEVFGLVLKRANNTPDFVEIGSPMNATGIIDDDDEPGKFCGKVWCKCQDIV